MPNKTTEWSSLQNHAMQMKNQNINALFEADKVRFDDLSFKLKTDKAEMLYDISKQAIDKDVLAELIALAKAQGVEGKRDAMMSGAVINTTEGRAVEHTTLRDPARDLSQITAISNKVRSGEWLGASGKPITDIVHVGLGGSGLGPELVHHALIEHKHAGLNFHFVTNVDGTDMSRALAACNPETTLFIIVSKSFTTQETRMNSNTGLTWLKAHYGDKDFVGAHYIAITAKPDLAKEYGLMPDNILAFSDSIGGRYSIWSGVGLTNAIAFGADKFTEFLSGARAMDEHFASANLSQNLPVLMGMIDIWNRNFMGSTAKAILPYAQELKLFPAYLQQLEMESNGKHVSIDGDKLDYDTAPVIFGDVGTTAQHSFFQLLHQGTDVIPADFIAVIEPHHDLTDHHNTLLDHFLAQTQALLQGRDIDDPHRVFEGNRPTSALILKRFDSYHLGMLLALYEHKVFVQSAVWGINAFDQFGVELGKEIASRIEAGDLSGADGSTIALHKILKG